MQLVITIFLHLELKRLISLFMSDMLNKKEK